MFGLSYVFLFNGCEFIGAILQVLALIIVYREYGDCVFLRCSKQLAAFFQYLVEFIAQIVVDQRHKSTLYKETENNRSIDLVDSGKQQTDIVDCFKNEEIQQSECEKNTFEKIKHDPQLAAYDGKSCYTNRVLLKDQDLYNELEPVKEDGIHFSHFETCPNRPKIYDVGSNGELISNMEFTDKLRTLLKNSRSVTENKNAPCSWYSMKKFEGKKRSTNRLSRVCDFISRA
ncbi:hypothetical protein ACOME3_001902 [Neoechinorhynchus agilis]